MFPSGVTHDLRHQFPYPIYASHANGPHKWDVDGNRYVDFIGGHGALLLGHSHPKIVAAVHDQIGKATHPGASHELEIAWGELVQSLIPSAERMRFTASGTEASLLAVRLARAYTNRSKIIQFRGHFHGWQDNVVTGYEAKPGASASPGILPSVAEGSLVLEPGDEIQVAEALHREKDIAAILIEPTGAHFGATPIAPSFLSFLREVTQNHDCLLIFDEVVTGFRVDPGGMQNATNIVPDITTLGKILAGGLPGGAVAGRKDIFDLLDFNASRKSGRKKIGHPGTFNANPLSASAGVTALKIVANSDACATANQMGDLFRSSLNKVLADLELPWAAYGTFSGFHLYTNSGGLDIKPGEIDSLAIPPDELTANDGDLMTNIRLGMLVHGIDLSPRFSGFLSMTHTTEDIKKTAEAFRQTLEKLIQDGIVKS